MNLTDLCLFIIALALFNLAPSDDQWSRLISALERIAKALEKKGGV
jgi:hypothetical protein